MLYWGQLISLMGFFKRFWGGSGFGFGLGLDRVWIGFGLGLVWDWIGFGSGLDWVCFFFVFLDKCHCKFLSYPVLQTVGSSENWVWMA
jgi:hypothetical protein